MRNALLLATAFLLFACGDIAPTEQVDLCKGNDPPSNDCAQCKTVPFAKECPRCKHNPPEQGCENFTGNGSGGTTGGDGGNGGSGGTNGSGGNGGSSGMGGQGAGSGGSVAMMDGGPDGAVDGGHACSGCAAGWDFCAGGECAQCLKDGDCGGTLHCDKLGTHACVQCVNDKQCEAQGMVCDEDKHTCVPCVVDSDCKDPAHPQCTNNVCGLCNDDDACEGRAGRTHCDKGTGSAMKGQCVQCLAHTDCKNPEPQCNSKRECEPCSGSDEACVERDGTTVCDTDKWSESSGQCVECTGTKYAACKVGSTEYVCDSAKRTCSTDSKHVKGTTANCVECISDAECLFGSGCVVHRYGDDDFGPYCLPAKDSDGCASMNNPNLRPFSRSQDGSSIDHQGQFYCVPLATCQAYLDATGAKPDGCLNNSSPDATLCGLEGIDDGYCIGTGAAKGKCSYVCQTDSDCPTVGLTSCGTGFVCQP